MNMYIFREGFEDMIGWELVVSEGGEDGGR